jgi:uncharacterized protein YbjT (DUF2867 family)
VILVTGATGSVGRHVVQQLHQAGCKVRALSRHPEKANFPAGVETVAGDMTMPETLRDVWESVEKVFWVLPQNPDFTFPQTARRHGVRHIVLLSALAVEFGSDNAIARLHQSAEQAVRESGVSWTFLRPGGFMTNAFQWTDSIRSEGVVRVPFGDVSSPSIDPRDIAAVAAQALSTDGHEGQSYILTGPECISARQQAGIIGELLGRDIRFEAIPEPIAREHMLRHMPADMVDAIFDLNRQGYSSVLPTVEQVTGRAPFAFRQWASDHIDAFR